MKLLKSIAATLVLCTAPFIATVAHAGDCGDWVTGGSYVTTVISIVGGPHVPPATGSTTTWVATAEFVSKPCPNEGIDTTPTGGTQVDCAALQATCNKSCEQQEKKETARCGYPAGIPLYGPAIQAACTEAAIARGEACTAGCKKAADDCKATNNI
jgi:hypothetical protein